MFLQGSFAIHNTEIGTRHLFRGLFQSIPHARCLHAEPDVVSVIKDTLKCSYEGDQTNSLLCKAILCPGANMTGCHITNDVVSGSVRVWIALL